MERIAAQFPRDAGFVARDADVELALTERVRIPAQPFDPACVALVRETAARLGYSTLDDRVRRRARRDLRGAPWPRAR